MNPTVNSTHQAKKEGFPQKLRIKKESEFKRTLWCGVKRKGDHLIVFRLHTGAEEGLRFGIKIGKGIKKATDRNRIKRVIREVLRKSKGRFHKNENVVVLYKSTAESVDLRRLKEELESLIQ